MIPVNILALYNIYYTSTYVLSFDVFYPAHCISIGAKHSQLGRQTTEKHKYDNKLRTFCIYGQIISADEGLHDLDVLSTFTVFQQEGIFHVP